MSGRSRRTPRAQDPVRDGAVAELSRSTESVFVAVHRQASCVILQHVAQVTATDEGSPHLGARPADTQWASESKFPPKFPQPIGRELYRGPGTDIGPVLAAASPPPTVGICMLAVEPAELVFRCRTAKAGVALATAVTAHGSGRLDASMRECPAGGFPLCVVKAPTAAAQLRLAIPVAAYGRWLVTPEFLRFALAAAADQMAQEDAMLVAAATCVHAVMPSIVAQHVPRRGSTASASANGTSAPSASAGRAGRRKSKQTRSSRAAGRKATATVATAAATSKALSSTGRRTRAAGAPVPGNEAIVVGQEAAHTPSDQLDDPTLLSFGSQPELVGTAWSPNTSEQLPVQRHSQHAMEAEREHEYMSSGGFTSTKKSRPQNRQRTPVSEGEGCSDPADDVAEESEPARYPDTMRRNPSEGASFRDSAAGEVPMVVGAYDQPPVVGFDAQFKPAGFEQSVLESLHRASASLMPDTNTTASDRLDNEKTHSSSTSSIAMSLVQQQPLPNHPMVSNNHVISPSTSALVTAPASVHGAAISGVETAAKSRGDAFLTASPLSSDDEDQAVSSLHVASPVSSDDEDHVTSRIRVAQARGTANVAAAATPETLPSTAGGSKPAAARESIETRAGSTCAAAAALNSPGSMLVGLKLLDHSPVRPQFSIALRSVFKTINGESDNCLTS